MNEIWPPLHGPPDKKRFKKAKDLKWGETPFDDLTRGELLRLVQAYHMALTSADSVLHQLMPYSREASGPFWSKDGSAGKAIDRMDALKLLMGDGGSDTDRENIYRQFFRTAFVLLFPDQARDFDLWGVNEKGEMCAPNPGLDRGYHPISWRDLHPLAEASA